MRAGSRISSFPYQSSTRKPSSDTMRPIFQIPRVLSKRLKQRPVAELPRIVAYFPVSMQIYDVFTTRAPAYTQHESWSRISVSMCDRVLFGVLVWPGEVEMSTEGDWPAPMDSASGDIAHRLFAAYQANVQRVTWKANSCGILHIL